MIGFDKLSKHGRLGNALFQLAATTAIARRRGQDPVFNADWIHRPYFSVPDEYFTDDFTGITPLEEARELRHLDRRVRVYAQDLRLIEPVLDEVRAWLAPSAQAQEILDGDRFAMFRELPRPVVSVHVRRGDNVVDPGVPDKHNYFVLPPLEYYQQAIVRMHELVDVGSVAVFSDDPRWCQAVLFAHGLVDYVHDGVPRPKEHEPAYATAPVLDWIDLQLMATCDAHVVTGSTFGIWGALLADPKAVIRCSPVYGPKLAYIDEDRLFLPSWERRQLP